MVLLVTTEQEFNQLLDKSCTEMKLLVVDYFTTWCGPCQLLAPEFERISLTYAETTYFAKIDCDSLSELAIKQNISVLPTLKGYFNANNAFTIAGNVSIKTLISEIESYIVQPCLKSLYAKKPQAKAQSYLLKLTNNIINCPTEEKFRQLKFANKSVQDNLLIQDGVLDCLLSMGFNKEESRLYMPFDVSMDTLKIFSKQLSLLSQRSIDTAGTCQSNNANVNKSDQGVSNLRLSNLSPGDIKRSMKETRFLETIRTRRKQMLLYENSDLMNIVDALVDIDSYKSQPISEESILKRLLRWFKYVFFSWFAPPTCLQCSNAYVCIGYTEPTAEESKHLADKVELYQCPVCKSQSKVSRFPRYNHPEQLLITRTGRCGEWANCFSMILRAFINQGLFEKARFVMDWSDHVWCEVYTKLDNESEKRWIHVDPCECAYNTPLVYQIGWQKKINYVIGITLVTFDVQDITWRYTNDFKATLQNRKLIRENVLVQHLLRFHNEAKTNVKEIIVELVSFLSSKDEKNDISEMEKIGRTTGSVEWRTQRGELGEQPHWMRQFTGQSIVPTAFELSNNCLHVQYNCSTDQYYRPSDCESKTAMSGEGEMLSSSSGSCQRKASSNKNRADLLSHDTENWQLLATSWRNIKRKVEYDWQIVYLARSNDSPPEASGEVSWVVDLTGTNKSIGEISVFASSAEFNNASVKWRLHSGDRQVPVNGFVTTTDFTDCTTVCLTASLESGVNASGSNCWQQAQLCRQKSTDYDVKTLQIKVQLQDNR